MKSVNHLYQFAERERRNVLEEFHQGRTLVLNDRNYTANVVCVFIVDVCTHCPTIENYGDGRFVLTPIMAWLLGLKVTAPFLPALLAS